MTAVLFLNLSARWDGRSNPLPLPCCFNPGKGHRCPYYKRMGGTQGRCGRLRKECFFSLPGFLHRNVHPVASRYTGYFIPAPYMDFCIPPYYVFDITTLYLLQMMEKLNFPFFCLWNHYKYQQFNAMPCHFHPPSFVATCFAEPHLNPFPLTLTTPHFASARARTHTHTHTRARIIFTCFLWLTK